MRVADLIDMDQMVWKENLVTQVFNQRDAAEILKMPLPTSPDHDRLLWRLAKNGSYSEKKAYFHLMEHVIDSSHLRVTGEWKKLWKLQLPNRVKVFLWRATRGVLPTGVNLQRRGVPCNPQCSLCGSFPENEWHAFVGCEQARAAWLDAGLWHSIFPLVNAASGFVEFMFSILTNLPMQQQQSASMIIWSLWWKRNAKVWEHADKTNFEVIRRAQVTLDDWQHVRQPVNKQNPQQQLLSGSRWMKPAAGTWKCNVDVAIFAEQNSFGIGLCLRNEHGEFVAACTLTRADVPPALEAEAAALLAAMEWLVTRNASNVHIEMDYLSVVELFHSSSSLNNEVGAIISTCKHVRNLINNSGISFIRRQANRAAHALARVSRLYASHHDFDFVPLCLEDIILNEMI